MTTGINLQKSQSINLSKITESTSGSEGLKSVCLGADWGRIKKGWFGDTEAVDLDASVVMYDSDKNVLDTVYFNHKVSNDNSIRHSGDDRGGDDVADGKDNEVIMCNLLEMNHKVKYLSLVLNSYSGQDFGEIPFVKARVYTGIANSPTEVLGTLNIANEASFKNKTAMILATLTKDATAGWSFKAISEPSTAKNVKGLAEDSKRFF
jgi:tellurium resistance protein TerZ